jgi:hypothetical protein
LRTAICLLHGATEFKISLPSSMFRPSLRRCALRPQHIPRRWNTSPVKRPIVGEPVALTVPTPPQLYQPIGDALPKPPTWRPIFVRVYYTRVLFCHLIAPQFVLGVSAATYFTAAKLTNDETEKWSLKVYTGAWWQTRLPSSEEMQRLARLSLTEVQLSSPSEISSYSQSARRN